MPLASGFGSLSARAYGFGANSFSPAVFIGINGYPCTATTQAITLPGGTQVGDLVIIWGDYLGLAMTVTGGAGGWISSAVLMNPGYLYQYQYIYKVVALADLSGLTINNTSDTGILQVETFRGPTVVTQKATAFNSGSGINPVSLPGFTKAPRSRGVVTHLSDRNQNDTPIAPSGFTLRGSYTGTRNFVAGAADIAPRDYVNGAAVSWTINAPAQYGAAFLVELT